MSVKILLVFVFALLQGQTNATLTGIQGLPGCLFDDSLPYAPFIQCESSNTTYGITHPAFGTIQLSPSYTLSSVYTNYNNCLLSGCMPYTSTCTCSHTLATCSLGSFYSLRTGVTVNGSCPFSPFHTKSWCLDTNWIPSTISPAPYCPNYALTLAPSVNVTGNYTGFTLSMPPVIVNYSVSNLTNTYKVGSSLVSLLSPAPLQWSIGFTLTAPSVVGAWVRDCDVTPPLNITSSILVPHGMTTCQAINSTAFVPSISVRYRYELVMQNTRWYRIKAILPGLNLTVLYCQSLCEVYDPLTLTYQLVSAGTYYQTLVPQSNYDCVISDCVSKDCCNPLYNPPTVPCTYQNGAPVCVGSISYFDMSTNNFTSTYIPGSRFFCSDTSGKCYALPNQEWSVNILAITLLSIIAGLVLVAIIMGIKIAMGASGPNKLL